MLKGRACSNPNLRRALFESRAVKDAARSAADAIVSRLGGLQSGGLSLSDAEAGALSVTEDT